MWFAPIAALALAAPAPAIALAAPALAIAAVARAPAPQSPPQSPPQSAPQRSADAAESPAPRLPRVLFLTHSAGFTHDVVRRVERGKLAIAERAFAHAARDQLAVECTQDCARISAAGLADFDAVAFYTTGKLPIDDAGREALLAFVARGGGFLGIHPATDTCYEWPEYGELVGGRFDGHPWHQEVGVLVEDQAHPACAHLGERFRITDEIYQFRDWSREGKHVLLRLDPESVDIARGKRADGDYALSWTREHGAGRVFYTALGHRPELWAEPRFLRHVVAGVRWTVEARSRQAPAGATVLFDGAAPKELRALDGEPCPWPVVDGALEIEPGAGSIETAESFGDFRMHVEFRLPADDARGQARGNSGVYLQRRYEVQILDSHGEPPTDAGCAALYRQRAPEVNVCKEPGRWQSFDIVFRAARFDASGARSEPARVTVVHDGVLVHDGVALTGKTGAGEREGPEPRPILLQDHGSRVAFRNVWVERIEGR